MSQTVDEPNFARAIENQKEMKRPVHCYRNSLYPTPPYFFQIISQCSVLNQFLYLKITSYTI